MLEGTEMAESGGFKLVEYLSKLEAHEFWEFKLHLETYPLEDGYKRISRSKTETADITDIAQAMVYAYQEPKALEMVEKILDDINRKDLSQRVKNDRLELFPAKPVSEDSEETENEKLVLDMCDRFFGTQKREVTLDPDTAFPTLLVSQDRKSVKLGDRRQYFSRNAERFDFLPCVLGAPAVSRGLLEWEVEVGAGKRWVVGAAKKAAERTGPVYITAEKGFWGLELSEGEYHALSTPKTKLHLPAPLRRVKVQLDCSLQRLSFYNSHTDEHLFTFNYPFPEMVPFFMTWDQNVSLQLCP